jgi:hypothetical protein
LKPVRSTDLVNVTSDYSTMGSYWEYYNTVYQLLDFAHDWPNGMAAHFAWPEAGTWRVTGLWSSDTAMETFFGRVAVESISRAIQLLGAIPNRDGATDVEPDRHRLLDFQLGPLSRKFCDIGEDRDGAAISVLGTDPIGVQLDVTGMDFAVYESIAKELGYRDSIPSGLIARYAAEVDDGVRIFEVWNLRGHALAALGSTVLPAIEETARAQNIELLSNYSTHDLKRIVFDPAAVGAFGF